MGKPWLKTPMTLQLAEQAEQILFFLCIYRAGLNQPAGNGLRLGAVHDGLRFIPLRQLGQGFQRLILYGFAAMRLAIYPHSRQ